MSRIKQTKQGNVNSLLWTQQDNQTATISYNGSVFAISAPVTFAGAQQLLPNGTAAAPSLAFTNTTGMGMYRSGSNVIGFSTAGSERVTIDAQGDLNVGSYISIGNGGTGSIVGQKVAVISGDAVDTTGAYTISAAESGTMFLFDKADGLTFTLPSAVVGLNYKFFITIASSAANYGIDTDGTDNFEGLIVIHDKDQVYDAVTLLQHLGIGAGTATHIDMTATTTGGLQGGWIDVVAITTDRWAVRGDLVGDSNVVTCFS